MHYTISKHSPVLCLWFMTMLQKLTLRTFSNIRISRCIAPNIPDSSDGIRYIIQIAVSCGGSSAGTSSYLNENYENGKQLTIKFILFNRIMWISRQPNIHFIQLNYYFWTFSGISFLHLFSLHFIDIFVIHKSSVSNSIW